ncbi:MAG: helix-turn-helix transcriptional regulator [Agarilytica sp.]
MKIEQRLKLARENANYTQTELGEKIGKSKGSIIAYEKDASGISLKAAMAIASVTDKTIEWIANGSIKEENSDSELARLFKEVSVLDPVNIQKIQEVIEAMLLKAHATKYTSSGY